MFNDQVQVSRKKSPVDVAHGKTSNSSKVKNVDGGKGEGLRNQAVL